MGSLMIENYRLAETIIVDGVNLTNGLRHTYIYTNYDLSPVPLVIGLAFLIGGSIMFIYADKKYKQMLRVRNANTIGERQP